MQTQSKQIDFTGQQFYCGIDVHKKSWSVTVATDEYIVKTFTQDANADLLAKHLKTHYPGGIFTAGYEAGYFGYGLHRMLESNGIHCMVIHPADIPTTDKDRDQKRDPRDSCKIAKAIRNNEVNAVWVPSIILESDRQLLRTREKLSRDRTRMKNRIKALLQLNGITYPEAFKQTGSHWSGRFITWLDTLHLTENSGTESLQCQVRHLRFLRQEIVVITKKIKALSNTKAYDKMFQQLNNLPGIGLITAMTVIMEIGDIKRFKNVDQFRSYVGFIPRSHSSGEKEYHGKITSRANSHLRYLLAEATWMAIRRDTGYLYIYKEYRKRMKENKALVRTASKLVGQIYYCLKNNVG